MFFQALHIVRRYRMESIFSIICRGLSIYRPWSQKSLTNSSQHLNLQGDIGGSENRKTNKTAPNRILCNPNENNADETTKT